MEPSFAEADGFFGIFRSHRITFRHCFSFIGHPKQRRECYIEIVPLFRSLIRQKLTLEKAKVVKFKCWLAFLLDLISTA